MNHTSSAAKSPNPARWTGERTRERARRMRQIDSGALRPENGVLVCTVTCCDVWNLIGFKLGAGDTSPHLRPVGQPQRRAFALGQAWGTMARETPAKRPVTIVRKVRARRPAAVPV